MCRAAPTRSLDRLQDVVDSAIDTAAERAYQLGRDERYLAPTPGSLRSPVRCPACGSPEPLLHPAVSGGGEVTSLCPDPYHAVNAGAR